MSTTLLHSQACQHANAKIYVFSDSVLCLGKMGPNPVESWEKQIQWYSETNYFSELNRIDGKPMEFEWKIFPGLTTAGILNEIQRNDGRITLCSSRLQGRIIFMSMFNDIVWMRKEIKNYVKIIQKELKNALEDFLAVIGPSLGLAQKRSGAPPTIPNKRILGSDAQKMMQNFQRPGHPIFRCTSALERGDLRSKGGGKKSIHFNVSTQNIELLLQMVISVNQRSIYGAVADFIEELPVGQKAPENPAAQVNGMKKRFLHNLLPQKCRPTAHGNLLQKYEQ